MNQSDEAVYMMLISGELFDIIDKLLNLRMWTNFILVTPWS